MPVTKGIKSREFVLLKKNAHDLCSLIKSD